VKIKGENDSAMHAMFFQIFFSLIWDLDSKLRLQDTCHQRFVFQRYLEDKGKKIQDGPSA